MMAARCWVTSAGAALPLMAVQPYSGMAVSGAGGAGEG